MADWRDELRPASFRGIGFLYSQAEASGNGRRVVVHEYPQREDWDVEDNGALTKRFTISGYLLASKLGADFWPARDRLEAAFNRPGAGTLVHPYYGTRQVHVESAPFSYSTRSGGQVSFELSCVLASNTSAQPGAATDTRAVMREHAGLVMDARVAAFLHAFSTRSWPEFVRRGARLVVSKAAVTLGLDIDASALNMAANAVVVVLLQGRDSLGDLSMADALSASIFGADLAVPSQATPSGRRMAGNQVAVVDLTQTIGVVSAVDHIADTDFASFDDALALRNQLLGAIDGVMVRAPDDVYTALADLRSAVIDDVDRRAGPLARITHYTPQQTAPAITLAWRLYAAPTRDAEIVRRNTVVNPCFVPGGRSIEVLNA